MGSIRYLAMIELRCRLRRGLVLVALVAVVTGVVLAGVAGARRTSTSFDRFRDAHRSPDVELQVDTDDAAADLARIRRLPAVAALGEVGVVFLRPAATTDIPGADVIGLVPIDGVVGRDVERLAIVDGRRADPRRSDEIVVNESAARRYGVKPGDRLPLEAAGQEQLFAWFEGEDDFSQLEGPVVDARVVGIARSTFDLTDNDRGAEIVLTPAYWERHGDAVAAFRGVGLARLRGGEAAVAGLERDARAIVGDPTAVEVNSSTDKAGRLADALDTTALALYLFAGVAGVVGLVAVAQVVSRHLSTEREQERALAAIGISSRERTGSLVLSTAPLLAAGVLGGIAVAVALSPLAPIGLGRRAEPDPGLRVDVGVLVVGAVVLTLLIGAIVVIAAHRAARIRIDRTRRPRRALAPATSMPLTARVSISSTWSGAAPARAVPVRAAIAGASLGLVGAVAALTFASSLDRLVATPADFGILHDAELHVGDEASDQTYESVGAALADHDGVAAASRVHIVSRALVEGRRVQGFGVQPLKGDPLLRLVEGRLPAAVDEVVVGPSTADDLGAGIGDRISAGVEDGERQLTVVGIGLFPSIDDGEYAAGIALTRTGLAELETSGGFQEFWVTWSPGAEADEIVAGIDPEPLIIEPRTPARIRNLADIGPLPDLLAVFLGAVALLAVSHALVLLVRRRQRELAVLRALGFVRRQLRAVVAWQATIHAVAGLAVGIPLGIVAGRVSWLLVAGRLNVVEAVALPLGALALIVPLAVAVANLAAAAPGALAARVGSGALRTER